MNAFKISMRCLPLILKDLASDNAKKGHLTPSHRGRNKDLELRHLQGLLG